MVSLTHSFLNTSETYASDLLENCKKMLLQVSELQENLQEMFLVTES